MESNIKAVKTGKLYQLSLYKRPFRYGYKSPKVFDRSLTPVTPKELRSRISSNRAKSQIRRLIMGNIGQYPQYRPVLLTLTFSDNFQSLGQANRLFRLFIKRLNYRLDCRLRYIAVPEFQDRGAVHYHLFLFNLPFTEGKTIEEIWKHGKTDIRLAYRSRGLFYYLTKYIDKTYSDPRYTNRRRYFYSLDNHPVITREQTDATKIFSKMSEKELIGRSEYDLKDLHGNSINRVVNLEYISTYSSTY